jgi:hypothetical protein
MLNFLLLSSQPWVSDFSQGKSQDWSDQKYLGQCFGMFVDSSWMPDTINFILETRPDDYLNKDDIQVIQALCFSKMIKVRMYSGKWHKLPS